MFFLPSESAQTTTMTPIPTTPGIKVKLFSADSLILLQAFKRRLIIKTEFYLHYLTDPCQTQGCSAPYNIGCRVVDNKPQCICPTCPNIRRPVCASDSVQDLSECHLRQQACLGDVTVAVAKQGPCGMFATH